MTWEHGTDSGYTHHGCRCRECSAARTAYLRSMPIRSHGKRQTYVSGCRCGECTDANTRYIQEYRARPQ